MGLGVRSSARWVGGDADHGQNRFYFWEVASKDSNVLFELQIAGIVNADVADNFD